MIVQIITAVLQMLYTVLAAVFALRGNTPMTILFAALMVCEEISFRPQGR